MLKNGGQLKCCCFLDKNNVRGMILCYDMYIRQFFNHNISLDKRWLWLYEGNGSEAVSS